MPRLSPLAVGGGRQTPRTSSEHTQVTIVQLNLIPTLCQKLGRSPRTTALMEALRQPLPRLWEAQAEQESLAEQNERDLLLDEVGRCDARPRPPLLTPRSVPRR